MINTRHGGRPYKKDGKFHCEQNIFYRLETNLAARKTTVVLSTNHKATQIHTDTMRISLNKFWEIGMPRNDILIRGDKDKCEKIRRNIGLDKKDKLILYAPTYRKPNDNNFKESIAISYDIDPKRVCAAIKKRFWGDGDLPCGCTHV